MTKITVDKALIEQAVDAAFSPYCAQDLAILAPALRAALAEPAVEPVMWGWQRDDGSWYDASATHHSRGMKPLYASPPPPPAERDVCKIMLEVVPGADGMGHEVYAKNVSEVVNKLTEMGQRIEDLEGASPPAEHGCKFPMCQTEEYQQMLEAQVARELIGVPLLSDDEIGAVFKNLYGYYIVPTGDDTQFARAIEQLVRRKVGL